MHGSTASAGPRSRLSLQRVGKVTRRLCINTFSECVGGTCVSFLEELLAEQQRRRCSGTIHHNTPLLVYSVHISNEQREQTNDSSPARPKILAACLFTRTDSKQASLITALDNCALHVATLLYEQFISIYIVLHPSEGLKRKLTSSRCVLCSWYSLTL